MQGEPLNVQWKRGQFNTYYALMKIRIGGKEELTIGEGDEFEYDGSVLKYAGAEHPQYGLRGMFVKGWVSDAPPEDGAYVRPHQATRNVARSQSVNRDLSNVQRRGPNARLDADSLDEEVVLNVADRARVRTQDARGGGRGHLSAEHNRRQASARGMRIDTDEVEDQQAVEIGRIRTPSHLKVNVTDSRNANLKNDLENLQGSGFIRDRGAPVVERSTRKVTHTEGVTITTNIGGVDRTVREEADSEGVEVSRVRHSSKQRRSEGGVEIRDTSNIRAERAAAQRPAAGYKVNTKLSPKVRVARAIDPSFPADWKFEGRLSDRMAAVKAHGPTPEFLDALYAAEGDAMRRSLEKAYPDQFGQS